jgi:CubicO group peptidase (beta-lactamase class C family)
MEKIRNILLICCTAFVVAACSNNEVKNEITAASDEYISSHFFNGAYLFANEKEILHQGVFGLSSFEKGTKLHADQVMPIASGTKTMTAAAILKLAEEKKLAVEDSVAKHLTMESGVWGNSGVPQWAKLVTIHQLLTHTSGVPEYFMQVKLDVTKSHEAINSDILNFVANKQLQEPKYSYCNTNYVILGVIIEKVSGKKLADFYKEYFFTPLGMKDTKMLLLSEAVDIQNNPENYSYPIRYFVTPNNTVKPNINPAIVENAVMVPYADGGVVSTTSDLVKWHKALASSKVISKESYKLMTTKYYDISKDSTEKKYVGYGMFVIETQDGKVRYGHAGNAMGIRSESGYLPNEGLYYAILSNMMLYVPENLQAKIDLTKEENKVDIFPYLSYVLSKIKAQ